jgi:hypothetical protein
MPCSLPLSQSRTTTTTNSLPPALRRAAPLRRAAASPSDWHRSFHTPTPRCKVKQAPPTQLLLRLECRPFVQRLLRRQLLLPGQQTAPEPALAGRRITLPSPNAICCVASANRPALRRPLPPPCSLSSWPDSPIPPSRRNICRIKAFLLSLPRSAACLLLLAGKGNKHLQLQGHTRYTYTAKRNKKEWS